MGKRRNKREKLKTPLEHYLPEFMEHRKSDGKKKVNSYASIQLRKKKGTT